MGYINYDLSNSCLAGSLVPLPGAFAFLPPGLSGPGIYMIVNSKTDNRYVGKSKQLTNRFKTRMETICELGLSVAQMNRITIFWGHVSVADTNAVLPIPPMQGVPPPPPPPPTPVPIGGYSGDVNLYGSVDGHNIELERLLIRVVMKKFFGGYVTNNKWGKINSTYRNPTGNPITIRVDWGGGGGFDAGHKTAVWGVNEAM